MSATPEGERLIAAYYYLAPRVVADVAKLEDSKTLYATIYKEDLIPILEAINSCQHTKVLLLYIHMMVRVLSILGDKHGCF